MTKEQIKRQIKRTVRGIKIIKEEIKELENRIEKITEDNNNYNNGSLYYELQKEAEFYQLHLEDSYEDLKKFDNQLTELKEALKKA